MDNYSSEARVYHAMRQRSAALIDVDSGGAITLPPLLVSFIEHLTSTNHDKAGV